MSFGYQNKFSTPENQPADDDVVLEEVPEDLENHTPADFSANVTPPAPRPAPELADPTDTGAEATA